MNKNLGSWNNRASQLNHGGMGWNSWCMNTNYRTPRFNVCFVVSANFGLLGHFSNNNIESVY